MKLTLLRADEYRIMKWKNGGGQTAEIALSPSHARFPEDPFLWRLSTAQMISNGPFSVFPGYNRFLLLIGKNPIKLKLAEEKLEITPQFNEPVHFKGEQKVHSELLEGPATDLNLIYQREKVEVHFEVIPIKKKPRSFSIQGNEVLIFALSGSAEISVYPGELKQKIQAKETLFLERSQVQDEKDCLILIEPTSALSEFAFIELNPIKGS